jgi:hypothetical protein
MLSVNKPLMDAAFSKLCIKGSGTSAAANSAGAIYKAAYKAYYDKTASRMPDSDPADADIKADLASKGLLVSDVKRELENDAHEFASLFTDAMDEILKEISKQIDAHVKAASINIVVPALMPTIVSPMGPCSGSLTISETMGAQITIL